MFASTLTYESETWVLTDLKLQWKKNRRCYVTRPDKIRNEAIIKSLGVVPVMSKSKTNELVRTPRQNEEGFENYLRNGIGWKEKTGMASENLEPNCLNSTNKKLQLEKSSKEKR